MKAIYTIIEDHPNEIDEWWTDKGFITTLDRISNDLKSGADKGFLWEELKNELLDIPNKSTGMENKALLSSVAAKYFQKDQFYPI